MQTTTSVLQAASVELPRRLSEAELSRANDASQHMLQLLSLRATKKDGITPNPVVAGPGTATWKRPVTASQLPGPATATTSPSPTTQWKQVPKLNWKPLQVDAHGAETAPSSRHVTPRQPSSRPLSAREYWGEYCVNNGVTFWG